MGGVGSGRHWHWDARSTTSDYRSIDVRRWARDGLLEPGQSFGWQWSADGKEVASIRARSGHGRVRLIYRSRSHGDAWEELDYPVLLSSTPCHFGGHRDWFLCPARGCGRRVAILYGGKVFACRHCHQLAYHSQREKPFERSYNRADRIRERLGWETGLDAEYGVKPRGMHWQTFNRLVNELGYWEEVHARDFQRHFAK